MSEKFVTPEPLPTPYEREILTILIEECAEVQQRATKLLRFGRDEVQRDQPHSNMMRLSQELGDLMEMVKLAKSIGLVSKEGMLDGMKRKEWHLRKYLQTVPT